MPDLTAGSWLHWALLSALFAALTAIFAKVGVEGVDSDLATFIRTLVVIAMLGALLATRGLLQPWSSIAPRTWVYLVLSGLATGASWLCYFRALQIGDVARVAPIDKLSVVMVAILGAVLLGEQLSLTAWLGVLLIATGAVLVAIG